MPPRRRQDLIPAPPIPEADPVNVVQREIAVIRGKTELAKAKGELRKERIRALEDWTGFVASKALGLTLAAVGGSELLDPNLLPVVLPNPAAVAGAGIALLVGKKAIDLAAKISNALGGQSGN
jgi:hypothetical protein